MEKLFHVALKKGTRSPFRENDELNKDDKEKEEDKSEKNKKKNKNKGEEEKEEKVAVNIDQSGIQQRIMEVPIKAGNYGSLAINDEVIYLISKETGLNSKKTFVFCKNWQKGHWNKENG